MIDMSELALFVRSREVMLEIKNSINSIFSKKEMVKGEEIMGVLSFLGGSASKSIIYMLLKKKILKTVDSHEDIDYYIFSLDQNALSKYIESEIGSLKVIKEIEPMIFSAGKKNVELLVTYPNDKKFTKVEGFSLLYPSLKKMIMESKKSIWIINPFFDPFGTLQIVEDLINSAKRGVEIRIVTRGASERGNKRLIQSLEFLFERFRRANLLNAIEIRDYFKRSKETMQQIFAVHSKMMIVDKSVCYLGSANITSTCLYSNLETGVVLRGDESEAFTNLFNALWKASSKVKSFS